MGLEVEGPPGHDPLELLLNTHYLLLEEAVSVLFDLDSGGLLLEGGGRV